MEIYFSFTILILNSPSVLPLSKNFLLQDSVSAQILRVVVAGSKRRRAPDPTSTVPHKDPPAAWAPAGVKQTFHILTSCWEKQNTKPTKVSLLKWGRV